MDQTSDVPVVLSSAQPIFGSPQEQQLYEALTGPVDEFTIGRVLSSARILRKMLSAEWRKGNVPAGRRAELKTQITTLDDLLVQFKDPAAMVRRSTGGFNPQPRRVRRQYK